MPGRQIPKTVAGAKPEKLSTQLFDYQIELVNQLSGKSPSWSSGIIYRAALDYFIILFSKEIEGFGIEIPGELKRVNPNLITSLESAIAPKSRDLEEKRLATLQQQLKEKIHEHLSLGHTAKNYMLFLQLDEDAQLKTLMLEQKGEFYTKHKRWPDSPEDKQFFEKECKGLLPQIKEERQQKVRELNDHIDKLQNEIIKLQKGVHSRTK